MAASSFSTEIDGHACVNIIYQGQKYSCLQMRVLDQQLCCDVLLGIDFQAFQSSATSGGKNILDYLWIYYFSGEASNTP